MLCDAYERETSSEHLLFARSGEHAPTHKKTYYAMKADGRLVRIAHHGDGGAEELVH